MSFGVLDTLEELVDSLEIAVDADELTRVFRLRDGTSETTIPPIHQPSLPVA